MSIISSLKQEKKRSQSTRPRSNPRKLNINELQQQNSSIINQTTDQYPLLNQQEIQNNILSLVHEQPNRKIILSQKSQRRQFQNNNNNNLGNYYTNQSYQNQQQVDLQKYFSQLPSNQNELPLPFFPYNQEMNSNKDLCIENDSKYFNNYMNQNQLASALETPKFSINPIVSNERNNSNESEFDINEQNNIQFDLINIQEESPNQISLKDKLLNSRRNEFFSFGKQRSSLQLQQNQQKLSEENAQIRKNQDEEMLENEDFSNIKINNLNYFHQNPFHLRNQSSTQKYPSQFVLTDISLSQNNINEQQQIQDIMLKSTNYKTSKSAIPFKVKNIPKSINNQAKIQIANQLKLSASPINSYTFYNYIDKENCSVTLPKTDSFQTRNQSKTPIQASHSIQLNQSSSHKIPKQQLIPPSYLMQQNSQQKNSGSIHIRAIQSQKQGRNNQKQLLNDSLNSINPNKFSRKMIQNQSFDNIQQTLVQENSNYHKRSQESKNNNFSIHSTANNNNSFDMNRLVLDSIICKENSLKLPKQQILPIQINKVNQFSSKKSVKNGTSQSFHQRMKTIM
ncbi:hypothetical protein TTHERM_00316660 (macronuclear) [Tetrahymena thermophila SB210]|uniref:Uncharacterized protein n=1 Tax=Tetrahymena thermophila (strain SB210) TaxID=312017 RepID=I7M2Q7_TETTS|nr:hypothetical protein TTHERM_00316660 [Tetrahymena thermophila SB210]EAS01113.1 hypothetical protein TTHERM_00316660 [Tetrahymena thermophila SB210]|eukprot:XP_001021358.1 hypothetical protein TTHERM_00316660 [Tetrahymena thermophila SB210]